MFNRVFRKKEDSAYAEIIKKSRVSKNSPRPNTAPPVVISPSLRDGAISPDSLRSFQDGFFFICEPSQSPDVALRAGLPEIPPTVDSTLTTRRPSMGRSLSSGSCELRNPFRSSTAESIQTISISRTSTRDSSVESDALVRRTVPTYHATRIEGSATPPPHKAAIFTGNGIRRCNSDPFSDECSEDSACPITPTTPTAESPQDARAVGGKRHHWSFVKSPKLSQDFLKVHIPSGIFSPPTREHRHSFWSRS